MNKDQLKILLTHFNLGSAKKLAQRIYGGLLHKMWRIETEQGVYAIKQLSEDIDLSNDSIVANYELTEIIASQFSQNGINAIPALNKSGKHLLICKNTAYLVYPWVNAKALDGDAINSVCACKIAAVVSAMHKLDLNTSKISESTFELHSDNKIMLLAETSSNKSCEFSSKLNENLGNLLGANQKYHSAIDVLKENTVVSHGDLDQKNVLWDSENNPILIDWESARKLNPTYEIVNVALDWSGINSNFNIEIFRKMIELYKHAGTGIDDEVFEAAFYGVLGNQINWLVYNINRACNNKDPEQQVIGAEQVSQVLPAILRLQQLIPELLHGDIL
jgi:thiamine kinase-like enzyme